MLGAALAVAACGSGVAVGCGDAPGTGETGELGELSGRLAHPGPWQIPAETLARGDTQYVAYTGAPAWNGGAGCSGGMTSGNQILREYLYAHFPQIGSIGGYSCRQNTANPSQTSVHGTGRALDIMIPVVGSPNDADNDAGDPIGNWLIENAEAIGIQFIIWDRWTWNASRAAGAKSRAYTGPNPHIDHLHVELSLAASQNTTNWFEAVVAPPGTPDCDPIPAEGGIIDERDSCFLAFGPTTYWRSEQVGYDDTLLWTNAYDSDTPSNWGRWNLDLAAAGRYEVSVYIDSRFGVHTETQYAVAHAATETGVVLNQGTASGWVSLGEFDFAAGPGQHVSVFDTAVQPDADQHIVADALRLLPVVPGNSGGTGGSDAGGSSAGGAGGSGAGWGAAGTGGNEPGAGGSLTAGTGGASSNPQGIKRNIDSDSGCQVSAGRGMSSGSATGASWVLLGAAWLFGWRRKRRGA
ncbi:MAG: hypothetical protein KIT72_19755 [Polyangiaceae bacterium]|nr:hypothetical protein [Polyangiaceae bacterium]MCW5792657.1 hypothetical protein [Polyangiaceae bacterium]